MLPFLSVFVTVESSFSNEHMHMATHSHLSHLGCFATTFSFSLSFCSALPVFFLSPLAPFLSFLSLSFLSSATSKQKHKHIRVTKPRTEKIQTGKARSKGFAWLDSSRSISTEPHRDCLLAICEFNQMKNVIMRSLSQMYYYWLRN